MREITFISITLAIASVVYSAPVWTRRPVGSIPPSEPRTNDDMNAILVNSHTTPSHHPSVNVLPHAFQLGSTIEPSQSNRCVWQGVPPDLRNLGHLSGFIEWLLANTNAMRVLRFEMCMSIERNSDVGPIASELERLAVLDGSFGLPFKAMPVQEEWPHAHYQYIKLYEAIWDFIIEKLRSYARVVSVSMERKFKQLQNMDSYDPEKVLEFSTMYDRAFKAGLQIQNRWVEMEQRMIKGRPSELSSEIPPSSWEIGPSRSDRHNKLESVNQPSFQDGTVLPLPMHSMGTPLSPPILPSSASDESIMQVDAASNNIRFRRHLSSPRNGDDKDVASQPVSSRFKDGPESRVRSFQTISSLDIQKLFSLKLHVSLRLKHVFRELQKLELYDPKHVVRLCTGYQTIYSHLNYYRHKINELQLRLTHEQQDQPMLSGKGSSLDDDLESISECLLNDDGDTADVDVMMLGRCESRFDKGDPRAFWEKMLANAVSHDTCMAHQENNAEQMSRHSGSARHERVQSRPMMQGDRDLFGSQFLAPFFS
ncbi:hypothetical protein SeLEV6574_g07699 [Synchytrium endobioticum]|uniref:SPX domain-containing protein n=1 Tax=Synchytrium endobioticum TaxID=286115 RepID=A0A507CK60_9FUNG|nr:hypothetical protein SeLEV6574_g07699 [Synchytrium endobioticum]